MKGRRNNGYFVLGFCALAGLLLLCGCESARKEPERQRTAIGRSDDVIVSTNASASRRASPQRLSTPRRISELSSQPPLQDYDRALVDAIEQRWNDILDQRSFPLTTGVVVVEFTLAFHGKVSNVSVVKSTVNDQLAFICKMAIRDSAPFPPWPADMRRQVGDKRVIKFTFNYLK